VVPRDGGTYPYIRIAVDLLLRATSGDWGIRQAPIDPATGQRDGAPEQSPIVTGNQLFGPALFGEVRELLRKGFHPCDLDADRRELNPRAKRLVKLAEGLEPRLAASARRSRQRISA
jgi:hypothetical protein